MKYAFITGISGQDGSYLTEFLLEKQYIVYGMLRRHSTHHSTERLDHITDHINLKIVYGDMNDFTSLINILCEIKSLMTEEDKLEIYNLAAQSHVKTSFEIPEYTEMSDGIGVLKILEALRGLKIDSQVKFYQASTSELYGRVQEVPQNENTAFYPRSPYGVAKLYAYWIVKNYREAYGLFAVNGILFNHESPRRNEMFVTRKITLGIQKIMKGESNYITLGNIDAKRDWGHAKDYCEAMWLILQSNEPKDYVVATNEFHSVREFIEESFSLVGIQIIWKGTGENEIGVDKKTGKTFVKISPEFYRPTEVDELLGDASLAKRDLGWTPKIRFKELVKEMMSHDCKKFLI